MLEEIDFGGLGVQIELGGAKKQKQDLFHGTFTVMYFICRTDCDIIKIKKGDNQIWMNAN